MEEADDETARMSPGRLEAFSDGVIAIAITLLSLEIRLPEDLSLLDGLSSLWPGYVGFVLSFLLIGQVWLNHHAIFQRGGFWWWMHHCVGGVFCVWDSV